MIRTLRAIYNRVFRHKEVKLAIESISFTASDNTMRLKATHPFQQIISAAMAEFFDKAGGPNFLDWKMLDIASMRTFTFTVQLDGRPQPSEIIAGLREALIYISERAEEDRIRGLAQQALIKFGYVEQS